MENQTNTGKATAAAHSSEQTGSSAQVSMATRTGLDSVCDLFTVLELRYSCFEVPSLLKVTESKVDFRCIDVYLFLGGVIVVLSKMTSAENTVITLLGMYTTHTHTHTERTSVLKKL